MSEDKTAIKIKEELMLRKFNKGESDPYEILWIEDGKIIKKWTRDGAN